MVLLEDLNMAEPRQKRTGQVSLSLSLSLSLYVQELWKDLAGSREIILISGLVSCYVR